MITDAAAAQAAALCHASDAGLETAPPPNHVNPQREAHLRSAKLLRAVYHAAADAAALAALGCSVLATLDTKGVQASLLWDERRHESLLAIPGTNEDSD